MLCGCCLATAPAWADAVADVRQRIAQGDLPGALRRAEQGLAADPRDARLRFLLGVVQMDLGQNANALENFEQLHQQFPELPDPLNNIALLHARAGQLEPARRALEAALLADPGHQRARINLGQVQLMLAVQAWERAAADAPGDMVLQRRLERARLLLNEAAR